MGQTLTSIAKTFSCRSSCSLNDEVIQLKKYINNLNLDDLKHLYEIQQFKISCMEENRKNINKKLSLQLEREFISKI